MTGPKKKELFKKTSILGRFQKKYEEDGITEDGHPYLKIIEDDGTDLTTKPDFQSRLKKFRALYQIQSLNQLFSFIFLI